MIKRDAVRRPFYNGAPGMGGSTYILKVATFGETKVCNKLARCYFSLFMIVFANRKREKVLLQMMDFGLKVEPVRFCLFQE